MVSLKKRPILQDASPQPPVPARNATVPAVDHALLILGYLSRHAHGAGVSEIGRAIGLNKSSCFKILTTMLKHDVVVKDSRMPVWRLGNRLIELGAVTRRSYVGRTSARSLIQPLVDEVGMTCVIGQVLAEDSGIVLVDRILPRKQGNRVLLMPIGEIQSLTAPVFGRAVLALRSDEEALAVATSQGGFDTPAMRSRLLEHLAKIRARGYAVSIEEHEPGVNAVGCALPELGGGAVYVCALIGEKAMLPRQRLDTLGRRLADIALQLQMEQ